MSNYESEHGEWTLPAADFAPFRRAMAAGGQFSTRYRGDSGVSL